MDAAATDRRLSLPRQMTREFAAVVTKRKPGEERVYYGPHSRRNQWLRDGREARRVVEIVKARLLDPKVAKDPRGYRALAR